MSVSAEEREEERRLRMLSAITSLAELDGYETEARKRGLSGSEAVSIARIRANLTPRQKRRK